MNKARTFLNSTLTFILALVCFGSPHSVAAQGTASTDIIVQHDVRMKTRDGVTLFADIYRPRSSDKFPVILMRTPYDKNVNWASSPAYKMVARGYIVVIQDVRGRYTS